MEFISTYSVKKSLFTGFSTSAIFLVLVSFLNYGTINLHVGKFVTPSHFFLLFTIQQKRTEGQLRSMSDWDTFLLDTSPQIKCLDWFTCQCKLFTLFLPITFPIVDKSDFRKQQQQC